MPDKDIDNVRGIGVADRAKTCALGAISLNFSFWIVPNFCSSS